MKKSHLITTSAVVLLLLLLAITFRPVPKLPEKECLAIKGKVSYIYEGGVKDVVFVLEGQKETYYINRGLEQGLNIARLKKELEGKEVTIKYPGHWSLLNPSGKLRHIAKVEFDGKTIFSEAN